MTSESVEPTTGRRFHLLELVGRGAFGEVYLAEQDSGAGFRRKVAIKILNEDMAEMREAGRRMRDEARILGRLAHRHIVTVLDLVRLGDRWAILMDYVPGADLEHILEALALRSEPFPPAAALEIGAAILTALDAAGHADDGQGGQMCVVHRDMKPSNVRLTTDGDVKVLDFGVARFSLDTREAQTRASGWIGTERYMAPERILCEGDTPAGDVYAAMATVLELLLGRPLGRTPVLPERHAVFVDEALAGATSAIDGDEATVAGVLDALRRGLAAAPTDRPAAAALAEELEVLARRVRGETLRAFARRFVPTVDAALGRERMTMSGILVERTSQTVNETGHTIAFPETAPPATRLRRPPWLGLAIGVVLLFGATGLILLVGGTTVLLQAGRSRTAESGVEAAAPVAAAAPATTEPPPVVALAGPTDAASAPVVETRPPTPVAAPVPRARPSVQVEVPASGPRVEKALVVLKDASSLEVVCGDVREPGTASVRITNFPAGPCTVSAVWLGKTYTTQVTVTRASTVQCAIDGGLTCSQR